jgi:hypothetical protein
LFSERKTLFEVDANFFFISLVAFKVKVKKIASFRTWDYELRDKTRRSPNQEREKHTYVIPLEFFFDFSLLLHRALYPLPQQQQRRRGGQARAAKVPMAKPPRAQRDPSQLPAYCLAACPGWKATNGSARPAKVVF